MKTKIKILSALAVLLVSMVFVSYGVSGVSARTGGLTFSDAPNNATYIAVSPSRSSLTPGEQVVNRAGETARLRVRLVDNNNNPVEGHVVRMISSSNRDRIRVLSHDSRTDQRGEVEFEVSSSYPGNATYSAYDVTSDVILDSKARVAYLASSSANDSSRSMDLGASLFTSVMSDVGNPSGPVSKFEFDNVPETIVPGEDISLTLTAYDVQNQRVTDYSGRVRFAVTSDNAAYASLPDDYRFSPADQGRHTFSLAFSFLRSGVYDLEVVDIDNPTVRGAVALNVVSGEAPVATNGITVSSPSSGTTYNTNIQVVRGTAPPGASLRIFKNDRRIGETAAGANGEFSFTSGVLPDGTHELYVARVNEVGTIIDTSGLITFTISTTGAEISSVAIEPTGEIGAGEIMKVSLMSTERLTRANMLLAGTTHPLTAAPDGSYEVTIPAPIEFGEYSIGFTLVDELGNETSFREYTSIQVGPSAPPEVESPGSVPNLRTAPDDRRVTLNWDVPQVGANDIVHYRVFYGPAPNQLTEVVDTFTDATTWYIPNLVNGETYYFAVAAVNSQGAMSDSFDDILPEVPTPPVVDVPPLPDPEEEMEALEELEEDVSDVGPEILWLVLLAAIGGIFYSEVSKFRIKNCSRA